MRAGGSVAVPTQRRAHSALLLLALLAAASGAAGEEGVPAGEKARRPDLLLVTLDTTRADALGCYGGPATPVLDALAAGGVLFERALSPAPVTLPAHASLFTGLPPRLHGVRDNALFRLAAERTVLAERLSSEGYDAVAVIGAVVLDRGTGFDQGFRVYDDTVRVGPRERYGWQERGAAQVTDRALELLPAGEGPFFLWVHYYDPHLPYIPPEPYLSSHEGRPYQGEVAYVDAELGRLIEGIGLLRRERPLLVAVAGDHGEGLGSHGESGHGIFVYQATQRIPLLLSGPGIPKGKRIARSVGLIDLAPTLLDLLALPGLAEAEGTSLVPLLQREGGGASPVYELESIHPALSYGWSSLRAVVDGSMKYIEAPEPELYDLEADPAESRNLVESRPGQAARLRAALEERFGADHYSQLALPEEPDEEAAAQVERLIALGYVTGSRPVGGPIIDPKEGVALLARVEESQALLALGRAGEAIPLLEKVLLRNPQNISALMTLGSAYLAAGETSRAVGAYRRAVARNPGLHLTHFSLARALLASEEPGAREEARRELRAALAIFPRHAESWRELVQIELQSGDPGAVRALLVEADSRGVADPGLSVLRGAIEASQGDGAAAERAFRRALELDPGQERAYLGLARLAQRAGDSALAAERYRRALEVAPRAATARTLGAILMNRLGDPAGALEAFSRAIELDPEAPESESLRQLLPQLEAMAAAEDPAGEGARGGTAPEDR